MFFYFQTKAEPWMPEKKVGKVTSPPPGPYLSYFLYPSSYSRSEEDRNDDVIRKAKRKGCQAKVFSIVVVRRGLARIL